jgi:hypothetical protein
MRTETTQIWGKEFPGGMFYMTPGNSSFFDSGENMQDVNTPLSPSVYPS